ncbi:MAG: Ig-like domain-containing protein [Planctomycetota bacterium]|nr:Ig-like domain-containing protein [Planctomycetota bacterium]
MRLWSLLGNKKSSRERKKQARRWRAKRSLQLETLESRQLLTSVSLLTPKAYASEQPQSNGLPDAGQVSVVLDAASEQDLAVRFQLGGTATYDYNTPSSGDYVISSNVSLSGYYDYTNSVYATQGTVIVPAGQTSVDVILTPVNDDQLEPSETAVLTLLDGCGCCGCGGGDYTAGSPSSSSITIADNDQWSVSVQATDAGASERGTSETPDPGQFCFTRSGETDLSHPLVVTFRLGGTATDSYSNPSSADYSLSSNVSLSLGLDYTNYPYYSYFTQGTVTIPAGQTSVTVDLTPVDDEQVEASETADLTVVNGSGYAVGSFSSAEVTIADNDRWVVSVQAIDASASERGSSETPDPGQFRILRSVKTDLSQPLAVTFQLGGTATYDYNGPSSGDYLVSSNVTFSNYWDSSSYSYVTQGTVVIPAWQTSVDVDLTPVNDGWLEDSETAVLTLLESGGGCCCGCGGSGYMLGSASSSSITIADNDQWAVSVQALDASAAERETNETPDDGQFRLSRSGETDLSQALTVIFQLGGTATYDYNNPSSGDYQVSTNVSLYYYYDFATYSYVVRGTVLIPAGQTSVDVDIKPVNDNQAEGSETAELSVIPGTNSGGACCCGGSGGYLPGIPSAASVTIADNDGPATITVAATQDAVEGGSSGVFTFSRDVTSTSLVAYYWINTSASTATYGSDYSGPSQYGSVNFPAGQATVTLSVSAIDDSQVEGPETIVLCLCSSSDYLLGSPNAATLTVVDNDGGGDTAGPRVIGTAPASTVYGVWNHLTVTFNEPILDGSFTLSDVVSISGPAGQITPVSVSRLTSTQYDVAFADQTTPGSYQLLLGPAILDAAGNPMNQDEDATNGEVPDDRYTANLLLSSATPEITVQDNYAYTHRRPLRSVWTRAPPAVTAAPCRSATTTAMRTRSTSRSRGRSTRPRRKSPCRTVTPTRPSTTG